MGVELTETLPPLLILGIISTGWSGCSSSVEVLVCLSVFALTASGVCQ